MCVMRIFFQRVLALLRCLPLLGGLLAAGCVSHSPRIAHSTARNCFIAFTNFDGFSKGIATNKGEWLVLTSPEIKVPIAWDELVASWNVTPGTALKTEARAVYPGTETKFYTMGIWSDDTSMCPRTSLSGQHDTNGSVLTDTLVLSKHGGKAQVRLTLSSTNHNDLSSLKYFALSFCNSAAAPKPGGTNHPDWGKVLDVPERRQGDYGDDTGWCSPTSVSMVMAYWSALLSRPELDHTVPETAAAIFDSDRRGTGNWPFNTAFAGSFPGMRAYVTRLDDISELEPWINAGIPPIISISSYLTNNRQSGPDNGHLIVCVGFTTEGDVITNNPGVSVKKGIPARQIYPRERVINAWKKSKNTVYLIYPESAKIPANVFGHWDGRN